MENTNALPAEVREGAEAIVPVATDFWHDSDMHLGVPEREARGLQLAQAGWMP